MTAPIKIAPSLLAADFARLGEEVRRLDEAGADWIHFDVMDGHFVPNLTFGAGHVAALRSVSKKPFDVHLMVSEPERHIAVFAQSGADFITIHPEAGAHTHRLLQMIRQLGCKAGVALNPGTSADCAAPLLDLADLILVMTVNPGWGGQTFIAAQTGKIRALKKMINALPPARRQSVLLAADGGITRETAPLAAEAGAQVLVAGSAILQSRPAGDYRAAITALRQSAKIKPKINKGAGR